MKFHQFANIRLRHQQNNSRKRWKVSWFHFYTELRWKNTANCCFHFSPLYIFFASTHFTLAIQQKTNFEKDTKLKTFPVQKFDEWSFHVSFNEEKKQENFLHASSSSWNMLKSYSDTFHLRLWIKLSYQHLFPHFLHESFHFIARRNLLASTWVKVLWVKFNIYTETDKKSLRPLFFGIKFADDWHDNDGHGGFKNLDDDDAGWGEEGKTFSATSVIKCFQ